MKYWLTVIAMMIVCGGIFSPGISAQVHEYVIEGDLKSFSVDGADGYSYAWSLQKPDSTIIVLSSTNYLSDEILFDLIGFYTIRVQATDVHGCLSEPIQKLIEALPSNKAPIAVRDSFSTLEDIILIESVFPNDSEPDGDSLIYSSLPILPPSFGQLTINIDGTFSYSPDSGFYGEDQFIYEVCDNGNPVLCDQDTVVIEVIHVNHAPFAKLDSVSTLEDIVLNDDVSLNDFDRDTVDSIIYNEVPLLEPIHGSVQINSDGTFSYTPDSSYFGFDRFVYEVCDNGDPVLCDQDTVIIEIIHVNHSPVATSDSTTTMEDSPVYSDVSDNDYDRDPMDSLVFNTTPVIPPMNGFLEMNNDGTFTYSPDSGFYGIDWFIYEVCDNGDPVLCDQDTVFIEVIHVNHAPVASLDSVSTLEDIILYTDVSFNDFDPDTADVLVYNNTPLIEPVHGSVEINFDGTFSYTPDSGYFGFDFFVYEVCDNGDPVLCDQDTVVIEVIHVNHPPVAFSDSTTTMEDSSVYSDVSVNDYDRDPMDSLVFSTTPVTLPMNGTLEINSYGTFTYTPNNGFYGLDWFIYEVCDNGDPVLCDQDTVFIEVIHVNHPPVALADQFSTLEDILFAENVSMNDSDPDIEDTLIYNVTPVALPLNGFLEVNPDGTFEYTPNNGFYGEDMFVYEVCDNGDPILCDRDTVFIEVIHVNHSPEAVLDSLTTFEDNSLLSSVADNDSDPDTMDVLTYNTTPLQSTINGTLEINPDGTFTYSPDFGFYGEDMFVYEVCDNGDPVLCDQDTAIITVIHVNHSPFAVDDYFKTYEDKLILASVLANDSEPDGDSLYVSESNVMVENGTLSSQTTSSELSFAMNNSIVSNPPYTVTPISLPTKGKLELNADGTFVYTPDSGAVGFDQFEYVACDDGSPIMCDQATVVIEILDVNHAPDAETDSLTTFEDIALAGNLSSNDSDPDGDNLIYNIVPVLSPENGELTLNTDGTFNYVPGSGFYGGDFFVYEVCDDGEPVLCDQDTVFIEIVHVNHSPVANSDSISTMEGLLFAGDLSLNDFDPDTADALLYSSVPELLPKHGDLVLDSTGIFTYTPDSGFYGSDYFVYELCDDGNPILCDQDTVFIEVIHINHSPVARKDNFNTQEDALLSDDVSLNDNDCDGDCLAYSSKQLPSYGLLNLNVDGTFQYLPDSSFFGIDLFIYEVCDNGDPALCDQDTVVINVTHVNHLPVAEGDSVNVFENGTFWGSLSDNDFDPDGDDLIYNTTPVLLPQNGDLIIDVNGEFTFIPDSSFYGEDYFVYEVCDNGTPALCSQATVKIDVIKLNHSPQAEDDYFILTSLDQFEESVANNDFDIDGDSLSYKLILASGTTQGSLVFNTDGSFIYTPDSAGIGTDEFTYEVCDSGDSALCAQAVVTIELPVLFLPPVVNDDEFITNEDEAITDSLFVNDINPGIGILKAISESKPTPHGHVIIEEEGSFTYTPNPGFTGDDTFTYTACTDEGMSLCNKGNVVVHVKAVNHAPIAIMDEFTIVANEQLESSLAQNDSDPDGDSLIFDTNPVSWPLNGNLTINLDGTFIYIPDSGFYGEDHFVYEVCDNADSSLCSQATVKIDVIKLNHSPQAEDDYFILTSLDQFEESVANNDFDIDGDTLSYRLITASGPTQGSLVFNTDGSFIYTPDSVATGSDEFTYEVCDSGDSVLCAQAVVTIELPILILPPIVNDDEFITNEDEAVSDSLLVNDTNPESGTLHAVVEIKLTQNGNVAIEEDGSFIYTPNPGFSGDDKFTYTVCNNDAMSSCSEGNVIIHVKAVNHAPLAVMDDFTIRGNAQLLSNLLQNDSDPDGDSLFVNPQSKLTNHGAVIINKDGAFTYTPDNDFIGDDQFNYTICDNGSPSLCATTQVNIHIVKENNSPYAGDDEFNAVLNTLFTGFLNDNDFDPDGDNLIYNTLPLMPTNNGILSISQDGMFKYLPDSGFIGDDNFRYTVSDDGDPAMFDYAEVLIHVLPPNHAPVLIDDEFTIYENEILSKSLISNDFDPDGDSFNVIPTPLEAPSYGSLILYDNGEFSYTPSVESGTDQFVYQVCDTGIPSLCNEGRVTIHILPYNLPVASNDTILLDEKTLISGNVIANDISEGNEALSIKMMNGSSNTTLIGTYGIISWVEDGSFSYAANEMTDTLDLGESVVDEFVYELENESGNSDIAKLVFIINGKKNEIVLQYEAYCNNDAAYFGYTLTSNFTIKDSVVTVRWYDGLNSLVLSQSVLGTNGNILWPGTITDSLGIAIDWPGWIYQDNKWIVGEDGYGYTIPESKIVIGLDGILDTIIVNYPGSTTGCNANPEMLVVDDEVSVEKNSSVIIDVLANDSGLPFGATIGINETPGDSIVLNPDGTITYVPDVNFTGIKTFTYEVCDNGLIERCETATVTILVIPGFDRKATNDINTTFANHSVDGNVLLNDVGYYEYNPTVSLFLEPINGSVDLMVDGNYTYIPNPGFKGIDNFYYIVCTDVEPADCDTVNVTIVILPDELPITEVIANDDETQTTIGNAITSDVLANDFSPSGETLIVNTILPQNPSHGSVIITDKGLYTYIPAPGYVGQDYFVYEVCGEISGLCSRAKVTITILPDGVSTVFAADDVFFSHGEEVTGNVLRNDIFPENGTLSVGMIYSMGPKYGTASLNSDGTFTYTPNPGSFSTDYFVYEICDDIAGNCSYATVFISVIEEPEIYADLSIYKQAPYNARVGDTIHYSLVITNHGNSVAHGIQVSDFLQPELLDPYYSIGDGTGVNEWTGLLQVDDSLDVNESMVIYINGILDETNSDSIMNYAAVGSNVWDPNLSNNVSIAKTYVNHVPEIIIQGTPPLALTCCDLNEFHLDASQTAGDDLQYKWFPEEYLDDPTSPSPVFTPGETTLYTLVVTDKYGQTATTEVLVEVLECPDAVTDGNIFVDEVTDPIVLNGSASKGVGIIYNWWTFDGEILGAQDGPTVQVSGLGKYYLQITDSVGCSDVDSVIVGLYVQAINDTVKTVVNVDIDIDVLRNDIPRNTIDPSSISIIEPPRYGYASIINDSLIQYSPLMYHTGTDDFVYSICDYYQNCDEARVLVLINDVPYDIPEAFSPNGDGYNDTFEILGLSKYDRVRIDIFDVYGVIVYSSDNYGEGDGRSGFWNGRYNRGGSVGTPVPEGTYYYILNLDGTEKISDSVYLDR